ncbi:myeloid leukemia factor 1-like [Durio zibethinus]|uniref:Myeloid leukemia factor 1-like n=1 Tax=Durio zibethinus TaxID=66656 RepID=A0A6P6A337_DURZI|nr:myeloid leukemia factor 1-like [Durio zibethinus]
MQGGRGGRDPFFDFGEPFGGFGGFGGPRSLISNFFGGRDPFDDPFFTRPFGSMFESSFFGPGQSPFPDMHPTGFIEHQAPEPKRPRGPIIQELNSDDEKEETDKETKENPKKHGRSNDEPYVEVPDDEAGQPERRNRHLQYMNGFNSSYHRQQQQPQTRSFTFQSSTVTYGGANGAYYTSSKTRRTGSDGVAFEETKEADTARGQASHRVSRGLHDKGHSVMRKLNSDGGVDTMQTLHNLNEDELAGFEEAWNGNARKYLPGWSGNFNGHDSIGTGRSVQNGQAGRGGWALPSTERSQQSGRVMQDFIDRAGPSRSQRSTRMKDSTDVKDKSTQSQGKRRN